MEKRNTHTTLKFNKKKVELKRRFLDKSISLPILSLFFFFLFTSLISAQSIGITDCPQLFNISANPTADYHLENSFSCQSFQYMYDPIENFSGTLDGRGNSVTSIRIGNEFDPIETNAGLFSELKTGAVVKNITFTNPQIYSNGNYVGALAGQSQQGVTIMNVWVRGVGTSGWVRGDNFVGGLIGYTLGTTINESYSTLIITGDSGWVGGLVGNLNSNSKIHNSYYRGTSVTGNHSVGGLVGINYESHIYNSYSNGLVNCVGDCGGLVGTNTSAIIISNSFYNLNTSNQTDTGKGLGITDEEMKNYSTFENAGWDIDKHYTFNSYYEYPFQSSLISSYEGTAIWLIYEEYIDVTAPTYQLVMNGLYTAGINTSFALDVDDDYKLNPKGTYIFSTNITGSWVNETIQNFTTTPQTITSENYTLSLNINETFGYRWYITDDAGHSNHTQIFTAVITPLCYTDTDCDEGDICSEGFCILAPPKDYTTIFINIALIVLIVTFFFVFITESKFVKMRNLK